MPSAWSSRDEEGWDVWTTSQPYRTTGLCHCFARSSSSGRRIRHHIGTKDKVGNTGDDGAHHEPEVPSEPVADWAGELVRWYVLIGAEPRANEAKDEGDGCRVDSAI